MDDFPPIDESYRPTKTFSELLAEGLPHQGGLRQLASAEKMANPPPQLEGVTQAYRQIISRRKR